MKTFLYTLLLLTIFSCADQSDVTPSESLPDDGINPTTEFEIYDSLATISGTILKSMQINRTNYTYNGDYPRVSHQGTTIYEYEYDEKQRLVKCVFKGDRYPQTRITKLEYNSDGGIGRVTMNWYNFQNEPGKDIVWDIKKENAVSKIVPGIQYAPFFPPVNPDNDDYKNLIKLGAGNQIVQMSGTVNGFMSNFYSSLTYDSKKNIEEVVFSSVTKEGKQVHVPSLAKLEYTKYVRSPFKSHAFAIVHHLTERFGLSPQNELFDFGVNMPVKTYMNDITSETMPSTRFGYQFAKGTNVLHYDLVYRYNAKKLPTSVVKTYTYPGRPVEYVDSIRFHYQ